MHFTQYIAPSVLLAGSAVAANSKRSDHAYDSADSDTYDASYDYAGEDAYVAPAEGADYAWSSTGYDTWATDVAADAEYDDYDSTSWVADAEATAMDYDSYDSYDSYDYDDKKETTTWVADAAESTGDWKDEECDDVPVVEECDDDAGDKMVQVVNVSDKDGNLVFSPNDIKAPVGSYVQFHFWPKVCCSSPVNTPLTFANNCLRITPLSSLTLPIHAYQSATLCQTSPECSQVSCLSPQNLRRPQSSHTRLPTRNQYGSTAPRASIASQAWVVSSMRKSLPFCQIQSVEVCLY